MLIDLFTLNGLQRGTVVTNDGVELSYVVAGQGQDVMLVHGFSTELTYFTHTIISLSKQYRVWAFDQRGHGNSGKPCYGMKISRLAADLKQVMDAVGIETCHIIGHSMGCSVIWNACELFGSKRFNKMVFIDEPPLILADTQWTEETSRKAGAFVSNLYAYAPYPGRVSDDLGFSWQLPAHLPKTSAFMSVKRTEWTWDWSELSELLRNHATQDWRNTIPRIQNETLIFSGESSGWLESQRWMEKNMPHARLIIFSNEESGDHDLALKNPKLFNRLVIDFLSKE